MIVGQQNSRIVEKDKHKIFWGPKALALVAWAGPDSNDEISKKKNLDQEKITYLE